MNRFGKGGMRWDGDLVGWTWGRFWVVMEKATPLCRNPPITFANALEGALSSIVGVLGEGWVTQKLDDG